MSDSLENMADTQNEVTQPVDAVVAEAEEVSSPQTDDVETELYVETEGDQDEQPKTNMSQEQAYAAFRKEKEKRQRKNEELQREKDERERLERELNELKGTVGKLTKGAPPTLESCDYDEAVYQQKVQEYYAPSEAKKPEVKQEQNQQQSNPELDQAEFYLYQSEQELSKQLPDYEQNKSELVEKMKSQYGAPDNIMIQFAMIAKQAGVDMAKANVALNKNPSLLAELSNACSTNNQFAIADVLKKAASKVQTRQRKPIDTQPEPSINSSGPIDNAAKAIEKAKAQWMESGSIADYNAYKQLKKTATK